ncbi:MAG: hypothetical protein ABNH00_06630 [Dokdonia sp.]|jgi:hypothetical protein
MSNSLFSFCIYFLILFGLTQCSSGQKLVGQPPFTIAEVYFEQWIAGVQGGGSGIDLYMPISKIPEDIQLEKAYFRNNTAPIDKIEDGVFIARFKTHLNRERDLTLHADPIQEQTNTPPTQERFPFELSSEEVGIQFLDKGKPYYTIIKNVIEKESIPRPGIPPQGKIDKG